MSPTIGFFECEEQLDALLAWQTEMGQEVALIAVSPLADYAAEQRGITHRTLEDFYVEELLQAEGVGAHPKLEELCRWLDSRLMDVLDGQSIPELFSTFQYMYHLFLLHGGIFQRAYPLIKCFQNTVPDTILYFPMPPAGPWDMSRYPGPSITMDSIPVLARALNIETVPLTAAALPPHERGGAEYPSLPLYMWGQLTTQLRELRDSGRMQGPLLVSGPFWSDHAVLDTIREARAPHIVLEVVLAGYGDLPLPSDDGLEELWRDVSGCERLRALFRYDGIDFFAVAAPLVRHFLTGLIPRHLRFARLAKERFTALGSCALLASWPVDQASIAAIAGARAAGATTFVMQHGGYTGYYTQPVARYGDGLHSDFYLCYGPGTGEYVLSLEPSASPRTGWPRRPEAIPVGSPTLQAIRRRSPSPSVDPIRERPVRVLFVATAVTRDWRYFSWGEYPPIEHARRQRTLVDVLAARTDIDLSIRPYGTDQFSPFNRWLATRADHPRILNGDFDTVIADADLIVLEMGSTPLLKALARHAQVVTYSDDRFLRLRPEARTLLEPRVWIAGDWAQLLVMIDEAIEACRTGTGRPLDDRFLHRYGMNPDADSAQLALSSLLTRRSGP